MSTVLTTADGRSAGVSGSGSGSAFRLTQAGVARSEWIKLRSLRSTWCGEYMTGMIRATLTAVPGRTPVLWAKLGVFAVLALIVSEVSLFVTFGVGQALLAHSGVAASLGDPGVLGAVFGAGVYITIVGLLGMALGSVVRNTAAVISILFGVMVVLPVLIGLLPAAWTTHVAPLFRSGAENFPRSTNAV